MKTQKTKITFIHPTFPVNNRHKLVLPLSIAQIGAYLMERNKDVDLSILDSHLNNLKEEEILEEISKNKPDVIGIGYWTCQAPVVNSLSAKIKKLHPEILIVHGGIHASFSFKEALEYCDVVVIGEGEKTFAELINAKQNNKEFDNLKGIAFKKDGNIIVTEKQPQIQDLDEIPSPAYELFNIPRKDDKEIGPLYKGQGKQARDEYVEGISKVLINVCKYLQDDGDIFIVANDKYNLYPIIAEKSGLKIIDKFKRPVLNRTEKDRQPYSEIIFHVKKNGNA